MNETPSVRVLPRASDTVIDIANVAMFPLIKPKVWSNLSDQSAFLVSFEKSFTDY